MEQIVDVVVDLETTGTKAGCRILSIGAVALAVKELAGENAYFYTTVASGKQRELGLIDDPETIKWWDQQEADVRMEAFSELSSLDTALSSFKEYLLQFKAFRIWGNSASFDLGILAHVYQVAGIAVPWNFRQECCYRTLRNLLKDRVETAPNSRPHHALYDAISEAVTLERMLKCISNTLIQES